MKVFFLLHFFIFGWWDFLEKSCADQLQYNQQLSKRSNLEEIIGEHGRWWEDEKNNAKYIWQWKWIWWLFLVWQRPKTKRSSSSMLLWVLKANEWLVANLHAPKPRDVQRCVHTAGLRRDEYICVYKPTMPSMGGRPSGRSGGGSLRTNWRITTAARRQRDSGRQQSWIRDTHQTDAQPRCKMSGFVFVFSRDFRDTGTKPKSGSTSDVCPQTLRKKH